MTFMPWVAFLRGHVKSFEGERISFSTHLRCTVVVDQGDLRENILDFAVLCHVLDAHGRRPQLTDGSTEPDSRWWWMDTWWLDVEHGF